MSIFALIKSIFMAKQVKHMDNPTRPIDPKITDVYQVPQRLRTDFENQLAEAKVKTQRPQLVRQQIDGIYIIKDNKAKAAAIVEALNAKQDFWKIRAVEL
jgi:hypothetical protein